MFTSECQVKQHAISQSLILVIYEHKVLDISKLIKNYPTKAHFAEELVGREISRFVHGGQTHPIFGPNPLNFLLPHIKSVEVGRIVLPPMYNPFKFDIATQQFMLVGTNKLTSAHTIMKFQSPKCQMELRPYDLSSCFQYVYLYNPFKKEGRNYALIRSLHSDILQKYIDFINAFKAHKEWVAPYKAVPTANSMDFVIKHGTGFSHFLHQVVLPTSKSYSPEINSFEISGPFGCSDMNFEEDNISIMALGTAVVATMDGVMQLMRNVIYNLGMKMGKKYKMFEDENMERIGAKKISLFASFRKNSEVICQYILQSLSDICKENGLDCFRYYLRTSENKEGYFTSEYLKDKLPKETSKIIIACDYSSAKVIGEECRKLGHDNAKFIYC